MKRMQILAALVSAAVAYGAGPAKQTQLPVGDIKWEEPFGPGGPKTGAASGDIKKGPYSFFMKTPAGFDSNWHTHDTDYTGVVLAGTVQNIEQGAEADAKPLPPGSLWIQPAKKNHTTKCDAGTDCIMFIALKGGFTFHPMTAEGKPAPAPKKDAAALKKEEPKKDPAVKEAAAKEEPKKEAPAKK